ncbi:MAG: alkene reductase [Kofleriaceae bacterium]
MLFTPFQLGRITLPNRIVMAPMTRSRAYGNIPSADVATYYASRASAGLLITEGTSPSPNGLGYSRIPGLYNQAHTDGWKLVTDAVHAAGGRIFIQLMHTGRISHRDNLPQGARTLAPSAITAPGKIHTDTQGQVEHDTPAEMSRDDIAIAIDEFAHAAKLAIQAGADGVELHGANGYLIEQFLNGGANHRTDAWGQREKFAIDVATAVAQTIGADRTGIRISPYGVNGGLTSDELTDSTYLGLAKALSKLGLVYTHIVDHSSLGAPKLPDGIRDGIREAFTGAYILSGGYDRARAEADLEARRGDLVAFGRPFLGNVDLVAKLRAGTPLLPPPDMALWFAPGTKGYLEL